MSKKKYIFSIFIFALIAFILGIFSFFLWQKANEKHEKQITFETQNISLHAELLKPQQIDFVQKYIGYVKPIHEASLRPYISGFIDKIYVKGGQTVKKNDILLTLQQDEYLASLNAAYADILKAEAVYQNKELYYERIQKAGLSVSPSELDAAEADYLSAGASLEQAKANFALSKVNYNYTFIISPIDGVVGDATLTTGNYISPSQNPVIHVVQYDPIRVVFSISDKEYLEELRKKVPFEDEELKIELPNGEIFENKGIFQYTDNTLDLQTNSMAIYADFKNSGKILTPNTYVTVLCKKYFKNAVAVSKERVMMENDGNYLYIIREGKLQKVPVQILATKNEEFILKNTFEPKDYIVLDSVENTYLDQKIHIIAPQKEEKA